MKTPDTKHSALTPRQALLSTPVGLVGGGVLAAIAAQLLVSADDFTRLYMTLGFELPLLLHQLVANPILLPVSYLVAAVGAVLAPRLELPAWRAPVVETLRGLTLLGVGAVLLHAVCIAWLLPNAMREVQKQIQY